MVRIRSVLIATDFSEPAERAAQRALAVAPAGSRLCLLHVLPEGPLARIREILGAPANEAVRRAALEAARERMAKLRDRLAPKFAGPLATEVMEGDPKTAISGYARSHEIDLIVAGGYGEQGLGRLFSGTTAQKIARTADRPVLLVRSVSGTECGYRRVLVAVDFSEAAQRALQWALTLCLEATVLVLHVFELPYEQRIDYEAMPGEIIDRYRDEGYARARDSLGALLAGIGEARCRPLVRQGEPSRVILEQARHQNAELVAVGSRGLVGWGASLMGSVNLHLLQQGEFDLLMVGP